METNDSLEKFILANRDGFDEEPTNKLWDKIAKELDKEQRAHSTTNVKMIPVRRLWQIAAAFTALCTVALLLQWQYFTQQREVYTLAQRPTIEQIAPELAEAEKFYFMQINQTQEALKVYQTKNYGVDNKELMQELKNLDTAYNELKKDFYMVGKQEEIIVAMIQNLQLRAELLSQQLETLKKVEKVKKGYDL